MQRIQFEITARARRLRDLAPLFVLFAECEARSPRSRMSLNFDDEDDATGMDADDENAAPSLPIARSNLPTTFL